MLPPETLPPGDPSGGVVYLRIEILSLQNLLKKIPDGVIGIFN